MRKKNCFLLTWVLFVCTSNFLFAQAIEIQVVSEQNIPISNYTMKRANQIFMVNDLKPFVIDSLIYGDSIAISHSRYETSFITVDSVILMQKLTKIKVTLFPIDLIKQEVTINESNLRLEFGGNGIDVIDFVPSFEGKYVLYYDKTNRKNMARFDHLDACSTQLDKSYNQLFLDCMGNFHTLSPEKTLQFYADSNTLVFLDTIERSVFDENLGNLISKTDNHLIFSSITNQNKTFKLHAVNNKEMRTIFEYTDDEGLAAAQNSLNKIIHRYSQITPGDRNVFFNGGWDGDIVKLFEYDTLRILNAEIGFYNGVLARPLNCKVFGMLDEVVVLNAVTGDVSVFDLNGTFLNMFNIPLLQENQVRIVHDFYLDKLYLFYENQNQTTIYFVNYKSSKMEEIASLPWVGKISSNSIDNNYKMLGNRIYFRKKNAFGRFSLYSYGIR